MKKLLPLFIALVWVTTASAGEPAAPAEPAPKSAPMGTLTRFDLNFPGGTPGQLVAAIEKATGRPFNAVIPTAYADRQLPALKMYHVNAAELFMGLEQAMVQKSDGNFNYAVSMTFRTHDPVPRMTDDSVWTFSVNGPAVSPTTRFYNLAPYLSTGLTVDDITTAVQTAWKMAATGDLPQLSYHKETKLLIAVGEPGKVQVIDGVLRALEPVRPTTGEKAKPAKTE